MRVLLAESPEATSVTMVESTHHREAADHESHGCCSGYDRRIDETDIVPHQIVDNDRERDGERHSERVRDEGRAQDAGALRHGSTFLVYESTDS